MIEMLFTGARTYKTWQDKPVEDAALMEAYNLAKMGPTSANCCPLHIVFIKSAAEKERLKSCLDEGNITQTMTAPVTALFGYDLAFYEKLPQLFPHTDARSWFVGNDALIEKTAFRNGTLQAAYFIIAARAVGLDCGPMGGFNAKLADELFFAGTTVKSNFLCNLGYGDASKLHPRNLRPDFNEACSIR